jgi:2-succinyl-5-enolpyruvyl-6-hydroxy-3-cyclohexene-1-carboxylate synthase
VIKPENRNILWATILADELARCGVRHAVIAPGSRSTPLAVAFSRDERFIIHSIIDERAAAFFGLGIGKASGMPAVVICTSGTAAANFFPAIIEASMSNVPMIVITADRPHELRDSGANQTIDQVKLYGGYVRWFVDVAPPHANPEDRTLRYLRTTVDRAVAYSQGANGGPVHLNVPFEKPLEPVVVEGDVPDSVWDGLGAQGRGADEDGDDRFTRVNPYVVAGAHHVLIDEIVQMLIKYRKGLIICGPNTHEGLLGIVGNVAGLVGYPVLAETTSGMRCNSHAEDSGYILGGYDTFLQGDFAKTFEPDIIIRFGSSPVSGSLLNYLGKKTDAQHVVISDSDDWTDEAHTTFRLLEANTGTFMLYLHQGLKINANWTDIDTSWGKAFQTAEDITWQTPYNLDICIPEEGKILADVVDTLPKSGSRLIVSSSNPVRHLEQFVRPQNRYLQVYTNRGVSGIDGTVATALGIGCDYRDVFPTVLVIGDLALYHDLNSLYLIRRLNIPLVIVCINNDGGGIFHRLPIANYEPPFRDLFVTPHGLTFEHAAKMFDIPYTLANMGEDFRAAFKAALDSGEPHLIEVPSDAAEFERQRKQLIDTVARRIAESGILEKFKASQEKHSQGSTPA